MKKSTAAAVTVTRGRLSNAPIANMTPPAEAEEAVDMYFRKMAQVSLLTREGEVELARRIEEGERRIIGAIVDSAFAASELDHISRLLYKGRLKVRDVVRNVDDEDAFDEATMLRIGRLLERPLKELHGTRQIKQAEAKAALPKPAHAHSTRSDRATPILRLRAANPEGLLRSGATRTPTGFESESGEETVASDAG